MAEEIAKSQRAVENREERRKLVVKVFVAPQPPLRLTDIREINKKKSSHSKHLFVKSGRSILVFFFSNTLLHPDVRHSHNDGVH